MEEIPRKRWESHWFEEIEFEVQEGWNDGDGKVMGPRKKEVM